MRKKGNVYSNNLLIGYIEVDDNKYWPSHYNWIIISADLS